MKRIETLRKDGIIHPFESESMFNKKNVISVIIILVTVILGGYLIYTKKDKLLSPNSAKNTVSSVQLKFTDKQYRLDYASFPTEAVLNIADFEKDEQWLGNHKFEDSIIWSGDNSLMLESKDNETIETILEKKMNLDNYQLFKLAVYLKTDPSDMESFRIFFANKNNTASYSYPITNLVKGWNFLRIPKMKFSAVNAVKDNLSRSKKDSTLSAGVEKSLLTWDKIERTGFELKSRSNSSTVIIVDRLNAQESEDYLDDWITANPIFLDLTKTYEDKIILEAKNHAGATALLKKLSGVSNYTFIVKMIPQKMNARSGLFIRADYKTGYGYYMFIDGIGGNRWQILKTGLVDERAASTTLKNGVINNFVIEKNKPMWLKAETKDKLLKFYLSTDGNSYSLLGEVSDGEFRDGGVGITVNDGGSTYFDSFDFKQ